MTKCRFSFLRNLCCDKCLQEPTAEEGEYTPNIPKSSAGLPTSKSTRTEVSGEEVTSGVVAAEIFEDPCDSKSLWDEAYNNLKEEEAQLLDGYEKILSHRLRDESDELFPASQENQINQKDSEIRRSQMRSAIEKGLKNTEKEAEFKQGATEVLQVALGLNDMITLAIKRVPEAALAWSVVSLSMQVSTQANPGRLVHVLTVAKMFLNPLQQTEVNRVGIKYVMSKMDWYWELPAHLLQESEVKKDIYAKLRLELRQQIVDLYKSLLFYEIKSVCSYFRHRGLQFLRDFVQLEGWDGTLDQIQTAETALPQSELNLDRNEEGQISNAVGLYINHKLNELFKRYEKVYEKRDKDERETQGQAYDPSTLRLALEALNNVRAEVASVIRDKANDTFLWVALVFQELAQTHDAHGILENVREMPPGLDKIYDRIMYKLLQEPPNHLQHCRQVLLVVLNAYRPLQLPELALLAGLPSDLLFNAGRVIESCSIVFLHPNNQTVHFVHQSAKDYLLEYMETDLPSKIFPDGRSFGHRQIVSRSLDGFSKVLKRDLYNLVQPGACLADLDESQIPRPDPLASMRYSCVYWIEHFCAILRYSDEGDSDKLQFSAFWKTNFLHWLEALSLINCVSDGVLAMAKLLESLDVSELSSKTV
ncbi:uncharacterized protein N7506_009650 [Penicillium brevicompactum]|uniref:uncharacterized protein n=1 Tax=Penicillium brevicompactum TaxID=5074 RepID=UPI00253F9F67|nr:uncharacterized protein N7506_009650 [Penicillium brevicompactum]KAJ5326548.1 hypothetical protein N7506_009650 [Penicillium brevicompactum]